MKLASIVIGMVTILLSGCSSNRSQDPRCFDETRQEPDVLSYEEWGDLTIDSYSGTTHLDDVVFRLVGHDENWGRILLINNSTSSLTIDVPYLYSNVIFATSEYWDGANWRVTALSDMARIAFLKRILPLESNLYYTPMDYQHMGAGIVTGRLVTEVVESDKSIVSDTFIITNR